MKHSLYFIALIFLHLTLLSVCALEFGDKCGTREQTTDCSRAKLLQCDWNSKTCKCGYGSFYQNKTKSCVSQIGWPCNSLTKCPLNATCKETTRLPYSNATAPRFILVALFQHSRDYIENQKVSLNHECTCAEGLIWSNSKQQCSRPLNFEDPCPNSKMECDASASLTCISGHCACPASLIYDASIRKCATPLGGKCGRDSQCPHNAICSSWYDRLRYHGGTTTRYYDSILHETCGCVPGYIRNAEGACVATFWTACDNESLCDKDRHLVCMEGTCQCKSSAAEVFSEENSVAMCRLRPGATCLEKSGPPCSSGTKCKKGHCECACGSTRTPSGICTLNYGSKCAVTGELSTALCNIYQRLACIDSTCECMDSTLKWNSKKKLCIAEEGAICGKVELKQKSVAEYTIRNHPLFPNGSARHDQSYFIKCEEGFECTSFRDQNTIEYSLCMKKGKP